MERLNKKKKNIKISELVDKEGNLLDDSAPDFTDDVITSDNVTTDEFVDATRQKGSNRGNHNTVNFSFGTIFEIVDEVVTKTILEERG